MSFGGCSLGRIVVCVGCGVERGVGRGCGNIGLRQLHAIFDGVGTLIFETAIDANGEDGGSHLAVGDIWVGAR